MAASHPTPDTSHVPITNPAPPLDEGLRVTLPGQASPQERWLWRGLLIVLCLLAYVPSLSSNFLWDDNRHANAIASGELNMRDYDGLIRIWTKLGLEEGGTPQYYPVTHTVYWLCHKVWNKSALGYRVFNIFLHAGGAILLWEILRRLRVPGAFLAAGLFALHPVMAESAAWTSEQKNTLSLLLGFTAVLFYLRFAGITEDEAEAVDHSRKEVDWNLYAISAIALVAAVLSKSVAGVAGVWILLILWWKGKLTARHIGLVAPFIAFAFVMGVLTGYIEHKHVIRPPVGTVEDTFLGYLGAKLSGTLSSGPEFNIPFSQRLLLAGVVPFFYAYKLIAPIDLMFFYPRWDLASAPAYWWCAHVALAGLFVGAAVLAIRGIRWPLICLVGYLAALFPAMGFFDVYPFRYSFVADHFGYHAVWILLTLMAVGLTLIAERVKLTSNPGIALAAATALLLGFAGRTYIHAFTFANNYELFSHTLKNNPTSWAAAHNLAREIYLDAQVARNAQRQYLAAREPKLAADAEAEANKFLDESQRLLDLTLRLKPDHDWAHYTLALVELMRGNRDKALELFYKSAEVRSNPAINRDGPYADTFVRIADILVYKGDLEGAADNYRKAMSLENPPFQPRSGAVRLSLLKVELAIISEKTRRAATQPSTQPALLLATPSTLPTTIPTTGPTTRVSPFPGSTPEKLAELFTLAQEVTLMLPQNDEAWVVAGKVMYTLGLRVDAQAAYREAVAINSQNVDALIGFGVTLGEAGDYVASRIAFQEAVRLAPQRSDAVNGLQIAESLLRAQNAATRPSTAPSTPTVPPSPAPDGGGQTIPPPPPAGP